MSTVSSPGNSEIDPRKQGPDREIYKTQGSNPSLLHCRQILYHLSYRGSPRILEWVAYPFSRGLPDAGIELRSLALKVDSLPAELPEKPNNYF